MRGLRLDVKSSDGTVIEVPIRVRQLLLAGYTGRDRGAVLKHVRELERLGVEPPARIPSVFVVEPELVRHSEAIVASGPETSGEGEMVLFHTPDGLLVGVGSDHTDRAHEAIDVDESKEMCDKPIARDAWHFEDVEPHWDDLQLRSWTTDEVGRRLYQEGTLAEFLTVERLVWELAEAGHGDLSETVVFGGTLPTIGGLAYGKRFEVELRDPVRGCAMSCAYDVTVPNEDSGDGDRR